MAKAKTQKRKSVRSPEVKAELEHIRQSHGGRLKAADVVKFAKNPDTELHQHFDWNDATAAEKYRRVQACQIIRVHVKVLPEKPDEVVRAYVSVPSDRTKGNGYQAVEDVIGNDEMMQELQVEAIRQLRTWQTKNRHLKSLAGLNGLIDEHLQQLDD